MVKIFLLLKRNLVPSVITCIYLMIKYKCFISVKSEIQVAKNLIIGKKTWRRTFTEGMANIKLKQPSEIKVEHYWQKAQRAVLRGERDEALVYLRTCEEILPEEGDTLLRARLLPKVQEAIIRLESGKSMEEKVNH